MEYGSIDSLVRAEGPLQGVQFWLFPDGSGRGQFNDEHYLNPNPFGQQDAGTGSLILASNYGLGEGYAHRIDPEVFSELRQATEGNRNQEDQLARENQLLQRFRYDGGDHINVETVIKYVDGRKGEIWGNHHAIIKDL